MMTFSTMSSLAILLGVMFSVSIPVNSELSRRVSEPVIPKGNNNRFYIVSVDSNKVLTVNKESGMHPIILWEKKPSTSLDQLWYLDDAGYIRSAENGQAFKAAPQHSIEMNRLGSGMETKWTPISIGNGVYQIQGSNGQCLDVYEQFRHNGTPIISYYCYPTVSNQQWNIDVLFESV